LTNDRKIDPKEKRMTLVLVVMCVGLFILLVRTEKRLTQRIETLQTVLDRMREEWDRGHGTVSPPAPEPDLPFDSAAAEATSAQAPAAETLEDIVLPPETPETPSSAAPSEETPDLQKPAPWTAPWIPAPPPPSPWAERWQAFVSTVDWEQFTGVKLFAWLGGLALFIAAGFFVKFSIDRNLIPPALRLAVSALIGVGLILGAGRFGAQRYAVMRHTLAAAGIGVLYSVVFAATLYYTYLTKPMGFALLALVSAAAFVLAVFHRSRAVSILGAVGAYATPLLVSTGQGSLTLLFGYLVIVNAGLFLVARRLTSQGLLLVAAAGTAATLGLASAHVFDATAGTTLSAVWILNLALFVFFLDRAEADPGKNQSAHWTGITAFGATLLACAALLLKPGWGALLGVTAAQALAVALAWRRPGWYGRVIPYATLGFLVALVWVLLRFQPGHFSVGFPLLLLYGACGGIGPLALVARHGLNRAVLAWFRVFPLAVVLLSLAVVWQQPAVSFWFWPLLLGLEVIGIGLSILFGALVQVGILVLLFVLGALHWLFNVPGDLLGIGFFVFLMAAGVLLCAGVFMLLRHLPALMSRLHLEPAADSPGTPLPAVPHLEQWLAAAPAAGVCVLLAASFLIAYPGYPHPGMATLVCFLALVLLAARRFAFEISGVAALIGTAAAQAVFIFHPQLAPPAYFQALVWSGGLFLAALAAPFLCFKQSARWTRLWNGWALFEAAQALFLLYVSQRYWFGPPPQWTAHWVPLALAMLKLPLVALLLQHLAGRPERNAILAFHGGVLLFYLSTLPVLVLDHGWIGLTFVFEAAALLWLNRRIAHPGLRWLALALAPAGLVILGLNLPRLKSADSLALLNPGFLSVAAAVVALAAAVRYADYPQRRLQRLDLPFYFQWLAVAAGFLLVNLGVADLFAAPGERFRVWPGENFVQWACYGLCWAALGALLWRAGRLPRPVRLAGLYLLAVGSAGLILLPPLLPQAAMPMRPLLNAALAIYLPLLAALYYLFHREPWDDARPLVKNGLLALFLAALFMALKLESGTIFATGYPFALLAAHTPAKAAASAAGWLLYGLALHIWPRRLDRPFRLAGLVLIVAGLLRAVALPFGFRAAFGQMIPLLNAPTLVFGLGLALLAYLTLRAWDARWPLTAVGPRPFWGLALALFAFAVLNIEIAAVFAGKGRAFSMAPHGSLAMQLAYSIGWLLYAIGLLAVGIRWQAKAVRWAAILAIAITACKIFLLDVSSLGQLYRVGSLFGLAVVLILVSFLYQRFLSEGKKDAP
jgi:hypothetical protein